MTISKCTINQIQYGSIISISLLLLININYFVASAQRATQRNITTDSQPPEADVLSKIGTSSDDLISGGDGNELIVGLQGSDTINSNGGDDIIQGNEDADKLNGGRGDDILQSGSGSDLLFGMDGDDALSGGDDDDLLSGGDGSDKLYGGQGDDILQGGPGADYFDCGDGIDIVIDSNISQGDDNAGNCEELLNSVVIQNASGS